MNAAEETPGVFRLEVSGLSVREIKDIFEDRYGGSMMWFGGSAYPTDGVRVSFEYPAGVLGYTPRPPRADRAARSQPSALTDGDKLPERITAYLSMGGLWNPELADHVAVRDLLIECRAILSAAGSRSSDAEDAAHWHEQWKVIDGFEDYEVSSDGRVRSLKQSSTILKPSRNPLSEYMTVSLFKEGVRKTALVHRLVAMAFCQPRAGCEQVNHINGRRGDNRAINLEWVSNFENKSHGSRVLKTLPQRAVKAIPISGGEGVVFESIAAAKLAGFTPSLIDKVIKGIRPHHKGYRWEYASQDAALRSQPMGRGE